MQAEEQENVKEVPVAGDSAAVDTDANATTADGAANEPKESAITPVTGEDGALQVLYSHYILDVVNFQVCCADISGL